MTAEFSALVGLVRNAQPKARGDDQGGGADGVVRDAFTRAAQVMQSHHGERSITDWPFENFWGNPYETKHSKYLGYFIDPDESHRCGRYLMKSFIGFLEKEGVLLEGGLQSATDWRVTTEKQRIDVLITGSRGSAGKFAIIIENKINFAQNREHQLSNYVKKVMVRSGIAPKNVCVLYLPLRAGSRAGDTDEAALISMEITPRVITYETHICRWLEEVLEEENTLPRKMPPGMYQNLRHYASLLNYLVNHHKQEMKREVLLKELQSLESSRVLPTHSEAVNILNTATTLKECVAMVQRGRFLRRVKERLKSMGLTAVYNVAVAPHKIEDREEVSEYDIAFTWEASLGVQATQGVRVSVGVDVGADHPGVHMGYFMTPPGTRDEAHIARVRQAVDPAGVMEGPNPPYWFAWKHRHEVTYEHLLDDECVEEFACALRDMRALVMRELGPA